MKHLAWITATLTYVLMVWGNTVSATGSGLACPDWPTCHGTLTPDVSHPEVFLEWGHRLIAATTSFFIALTLWMTWKKAPTHLKGVWRWLIPVLAVQILLGATTVLLGLSILASTVHLITALMIFSALIALASQLTWTTKTALSRSLPLNRLIAGALFGLLIQIALGGLVRHSHAGLACPNFPQCGLNLLPETWMPQTFLAFTHRWWGMAEFGVLLVLGIRVFQTRALQAFRQLGLTVILMTLFQVILGVTVVFTHLQTELRAIHAAIGYALWGILFFRFRSKWGTADAV